MFISFIFLTISTEQFLTAECHNHTFFLKCQICETYQSGCSNKEKQGKLKPASSMANPGTIFTLSIAQWPQIEILKSINYEQRHVLKIINKLVWNSENQTMDFQKKDK